MEREHEDEWYALRENAGQLLRAGRWSLRLGVFPAAADAHVIGIRDRRAAQPRIECRRWRFAADIQKFRTPVERMKHPRVLQPTIDVGAVPISWELLTRVFNGLELVTVPVLSRDGLCGVDGTSFEVSASRSPQHYCEYNWWQRGPDDWRPLIDWFESARGELLQVPGVRPLLYDAE